MMTRAFKGRAERYGSAAKVLSRLGCIRGLSPWRVRLELQTIHAHAATCVDCERAFAAASISSLLIKERTSEAAQYTLNANPFFETRVLAAWREQQAAPGDWSFRRLWSATGAIVASMAATTS